MGNPNPVDGTKNLVHRGRFKGAQGKDKRMLRHALVLAAEKSKNSKDQSLESYCIFLADERPELFVALLGRLMPLQAKVHVDDEFHYSHINANMPLEEMMSTFAARIKSAYAPIIEHETNPDPE